MAWRPDGGTPPGSHGTMLGMSTNHSMTLHAALRRVTTALGADGAGGATPH
jgi:hypothetical protein